MVTEPTRQRSLIDRNTRPKAWMDVAKGTAMFMVVIFHTSLYFGHADITGYPGRLKQFLEAYPMPAFFLISGLFAYRVVSWTFPQLWKRRLIPLLWLYVVWSLVRFVFYILVPGTNGDLGALPATDPRSILLLLVWPSNSYWFLYAMFWFTLGRVGAAPRAHLAEGRRRRADLRRRSPRASRISATSGGTGPPRSSSSSCSGRCSTSRSPPGSRSPGRGRSWPSPSSTSSGPSAVVAIPGARGVPFAVTVMQLLAVAGGFLACKYIAMVRPLASVFGTIGEWSLQIYLLHIFIIVSLAALLEFLLPPIGGVVGALIVTAAAILTTYVAVLLSKLTTKVRWLYVPPWTARRRSRKTLDNASA